MEIIYAARTPVKPHHNVLRYHHTQNAQDDSSLSINRRILNHLRRHTDSYYTGVLLLAAVCLTGAHKLTNPPIHQEIKPAEVRPIFPAFDLPAQMSEVTGFNFDIMKPKIEEPTPIPDKAEAISPRLPLTDTVYSYRKFNDKSDN